MSFYRTEPSSPPVVDNFYNDALNAPCFLGNCPLSEINKNDRLSLPQLSYKSLRLLFCFHTLSFLLLALTKQAARLYAVLWSNPGGKGLRAAPGQQPARKCSPQSSNSRRNESCNNYVSDLGSESSPDWGLRWLHPGQPLSCSLVRDLESEDPANLHLKS